MFDCTMFFDQLELLELRLNTLNDVVEKFIIVESTVTHQGDPKPLHFLENRHLFTKFLPKIIHIMYKGAKREEGQNGWYNENYQRDTILEALWHCNPVDGILHISDCDEIINPDKLIEARDKCLVSGKPVSIQITNCMYFMDFMSNTPYYSPYVYNPSLWHETPTTLRWHVCDFVHRNDFEIVTDGGWHFSCLGGFDRIRTKLASHSHTEFNTDQIRSDEHLLKCIEEGTPYYETLFKFGDEKVRFTKKELQDLPVYVQENYDVFKKYMMEVVPTVCNKNCLQFGTDWIKPEDIKDKRVIDVGSLDINGSYRSIATPMGPSEYVGIDAAEGKGVDIVCRAEGMVNYFGKESFDVVISTEALEHSYDWKSVISNIKNICKPNGIIIITTRSIGFAYHGFPEDHWRFQESDMREIFSDCIIEFLGRDLDWAGVFIKVRKPANFVENMVTGGLYNIVYNKRMH